MIKIVILATYWNESEWIKKSLSQIDAINPDLAIICDGCFDDKQVNYSTDGTSETIDRFCNGKTSIKFKAIRSNRVVSLIKLLKYTFKRKFSFPYIYWVLRHFIRTNKYRLNQAVTFNEMLDLAIKKYGDDFWFMTYDADQFYSDDYVEDFKSLISNLHENVNLLTAKEFTFNHDPSHYTDCYEKRNWNNMPHKYLKGTMILPTRDINIASTFTIYKYIKDKKSFDLGNYFHYKFRNDKERYLATYKVGDRSAPDTSRIIDDIKFKGKHPKASGFLSDDEK